MTRKRGVISYLTIAIVVFVAWAGNQLTTVESVRATPLAYIQQMRSGSTCEGMQDYGKDLTEVFRSPDGKWFMNDFGEGDEEDWLAMSTEDLAATERKLRNLAGDLKDVQPPPVAEAFHDDLIKVLELYASVFHQAQTSWFSVASSGFTDVLNTVADRFVAEATTLKATCGKESTSGVL